MIERYATGETQVDAIVKSSVLSSLVASPGIVSSMIRDHDLTSQVMDFFGPTDRVSKQDLFLLDPGVLPTENNYFENALQMAERSSGVNWLQRVFKIRQSFIQSYPKFDLLMMLLTFMYNLPFKCTKVCYEVLSSCVNWVPTCCEPCDSPKVLYPFRWLCMACVGLAILKRILSKIKFRHETRWI